MQIKETFLNLTKTYQNAINRLEKLFDPEFEKAVKLINSSDGHIVVCGMGKSGLVGRKISATLASTGTPSYFLHLHIVLTSELPGTHSCCDALPSAPDTLNRLHVLISPQLKASRFL